LLKNYHEFHSISIHFNSTEFNYFNGILVNSEWFTISDLHAALMKNMINVYDHDQVSQMWNVCYLNPATCNLYFEKKKKKEKEKKKSDLGKKTKSHQISPADLNSTN